MCWTSCFRRPSILRIHSCLYVKTYHPMVKRTKEEAAQTRAQLLAAAQRCFHTHGVSATTLELIARTAGVTRGAVYWHFSDKRQILQALCDEVTSPFIEQLDTTLLAETNTDPMVRVYNFLLRLAETLTNPRLRGVLEIMEFKCEFTGERAEDLKEWVTYTEELISKLELVYVQARQTGSLRRDIAPQQAAVATKCFLNGLVRLCLMGLPTLQTTAQMQPVIEAFVRGLSECDKKRLRG